MSYFSLSDKIDLPQKTTHHLIDELFLVIAEDIPTWMTLTKSEFFLFESLQKQENIENCLLNYINEYNQSEENARNTFQSLLTKIDESKFYSDTKTLIMDDADSIEKNIHVFITHRCNLQCPYCYVSAGNQLKGELSVEEWKESFKKLTEVAPNAEITFSGGEPLTKEGIFDIFEYTYSLNFTNVLFTNGLLIDNKNISLLKKYVSLIQISLDGLSSKTHDITRNKGSFSKTMESINLIMENKIDLDLALNVTPTNLDEITNGLVDFLKNLKYKQLNIRLNYHMDKEGFAINLTDDYFTVYQDNRRKIKKLIQDLIQNNLYATANKEKFKRLRNCGIGLSFGIDSDGKIYPCDKLHKSYGSIQTDSLHEISKEFSKLNEETEIDKIEFCQECDLRYICNGGCRVNNVIATGKYTIPFCSDDYKMQLYEKLVYKF